MTFRKSPIRPRLLAACAVLSLITSSAPAAAIDPVADLEAQYQRALSILKKPPISGVLVTEVLPESGAAAAGLRAGDIITSYYGTKITSLETLREQVAEAVARRIEADATNRVSLIARRGDDEVRLLVPREPLSVRCVEVVVNVPGPRNPPPNLRGTLNLAWNEVFAAWQADANAETLRTTQRPAAADAVQTAPATRPRDDEPWLGWERYDVAAFTKDGFSGTLEVHRVEPATADAPARTAGVLSFSFQLSIGDFQKTPAFVLQAATARYPLPDGYIVNATATRQGDALRAEIITGGNARPTPGAPGERHAYDTPLTAIVQPAVPFVAAALPHETDAALALHLLSVRDFLPRPGYVLATRGKLALPASGDTAWRVDLLHCGILVESYWFSDSRRLLCIESAGATSVLNRRVPDPADAMNPPKPLPATQPANEGGNE